MTAKEVVDLMEKVMLIQKYFPLDDLYEIAKDLNNDDAIMLVENSAHKKAITITWR